VLLDFVPQDTKKSESSWSNKHLLSKQTTTSVGTAKPPTVPTTGVAKVSDNGRHSNIEEKLQNIKNYRWAKGLCFKCGDKWNPAHKCSNIVSLTLVEELWQLVSDDDDSQSFDNARHSTDSGENLMELSLSAVEGTTCGNILEQSVIILIDSGSSSSFISQQVADHIPGWTKLSKPLKIRVANGTLLQCTHEIQHCPVSIQGHRFHINLKILPLQCYDLILSMDWLSHHSPMSIDWKQKWLAFSYQGHQIQLHGLSPNLSHSQLL
jgi:hypothetical protein